MFPADVVAIGAGAVLGAMVRYQVGRLAAEYIASDPKRLGHLTGWHTVAINVGGSFILGGVTGAPLVSSSSRPVSPKPPPSFGLTSRSKLMMGVGFCGSFTTFSTYSTDVVGWLMQGKTTKALTYVLANNIGGVAAAAAGLILVKKVFGA